MLARVQEGLSERGVHAVAKATGQRNQQELDEAAKEIAREYDISRPKVEIIHLDASKRSSAGTYLIVVTQDDRQ